VCRKGNGPAGAATPRDPDHSYRRDTVDTNIVRKDHPEGPVDETPHGCIAGVVYIGHLVEGEDGEEVEVFEVMPCKRCKQAR
jgi:hypothetical protein